MMISGKPQEQVNARLFYIKKQDMLFSFGAELRYIID